jgi:hypothetical protein
MIAAAVASGAGETAGPRFQMENQSFDYIVVGAGSARSPTPFNSWTFSSAGNRNAFA